MKSPRFRALMTATLVLATTLVGGSGTAQAQATDFYQPPSTLPAENGAVIRTESIYYGRNVYDSDTGEALTVDARRVLYRSTSATGDAIAVSGVVLVPGTEWSGEGPRPVVGLGPGTQGIADHCAVSLDVASRGGNTPSLLSEGYAVAITDYEGLGTPGVHTYAVGQSQGQVLLDAVRAAMNLSLPDVTADSPVAVTGYSQGGQSALWAGELQPSYAPELSLVAVAAGGAPGILEQVAEASEGGPYFVNIVNAALGLNAAYPELDLRSYLNWAGRYRFKQARDEMCTQELEPLVAGKTRDDYMWRDPLETPEWTQRIWENTAAYRPMPVPLLLVHATGDTVVPYPQAETLKKAYCHNTDVVWSAPSGDHAEGGWDYNRRVVPFLDSMFADPSGGSVSFTC